MCWQIRGQVGHYCRWINPQHTKLLKDVCTYFLLSFIKICSAVAGEKLKMSQQCMTRAQYLLRDWSTNHKSL